MASCLEGIATPFLRGGLKAPVFQRGQEFFVQLGAHAVQNGLAYDFSALVDRDLDHDVAFGVWQFPRIDHGIHGGDGQSGTNLIAVTGPPGSEP